MALTPSREYLFPRTVETLYKDNKNLLSPLGNGKLKSQAVQSLFPSADSGEDHTLASFPSSPLILQQSCRHFVPSCDNASITCILLCKDTMSVIVLRVNLPLLWPQLTNCFV